MYTDYQRQYYNAKYATPEGRQELRDRQNRRYHIRRLTYNEVFGRPADQELDRWTIAELLRRQDGKCCVCGEPIEARRRQPVLGNRVLCKTCAEGVCGLIHIGLNAGAVAEYFSLSNKAQEFVDSVVIYSQRNLEKAKEASEIYNIPIGKELVRNEELWLEYKLYPEQLNNLIITYQHNQCPVCGKPIESWPLNVRYNAIDIDKATGRLRGYVHAPCYRAMRGFDFDVNRIINAIVVSKAGNPQ